VGACPPLNPHPLVAPPIATRRHPAKRRSWLPGKTKAARRSPSS